MPRHKTAHRKAREAQEKANAKARAEAVAELKDSGTLRPFEGRERDKDGR